MEYLVLCIGNRTGGDDAIGPYIADQLANHQHDDLLIIDCGTVPENFTSVAKQHKPNHLVLIDAVDMGLPPGEIRLVPREKIGTMHISTHGIPLSVLMQYLEQYIDSILLIGIQPKTMNGEMSKEVQTAADTLLRVIQDLRFDQLSTL